MFFIRRSKNRRSQPLRFLVAAFLTLFCIISVFTLTQISDPTERLLTIQRQAQNPNILDSNGQPLSRTYQELWNRSDILALHEVPKLLQSAFIISEDQRFFRHWGVDWLARGKGLWNYLTGGGVRGASTITEQVVRMMYPRDRTLWSKWLEGFEAVQLESRVDKATILEFYLNQVPYGANRRGVGQAVRYYFNRSLATLSPKEILALVVLVRAPSRFDPYKDEIDLTGRINQLAVRMRDANILDDLTVAQIARTPLALERAHDPVDAFHFVSHVRSSLSRQGGMTGKEIKTTLISTVQRKVNLLLKRRVENLGKRGVTNSAALVVDLKNNTVMAWSSVGVGCEEWANLAQGCMIDFVTTPRQPGSTLKPFLFAKALEDGWNSTTIIRDEPLQTAVGRGLHRFRNYSGRYYGKVTLREALGNSLNIPAVRTLGFVTSEAFLERLHDLGFESLVESADYYGDGLALGAGEVTLYELVRAYAVLAHGGKYSDLVLFKEERQPKQGSQVIEEDVAALIGDILSDPAARQLEFGRSGLLDQVVQTAVKTGTSSDYRDAWAVGYNHRFLVGIWMGNRDNEPMQEVTGSLGPAIVLRSIFSEINQLTEPARLSLSNGLSRLSVCIDEDTVRLKIFADEQNCDLRSDYFTRKQIIALARGEEYQSSQFELLRPSNLLLIAIDPRVPLSNQVFRMSVSLRGLDDEVHWFVNDKKVATTRSLDYLWVPVRGSHQVHAELWRENQKISTSEVHRLIVR